jgi:hypothetical protein
MKTTAVVLAQPPLLLLDEQVFQHRACLDRHLSQPLDAVLAFVRVGGRDLHTARNEDRLDINAKSIDFVYCLIHHIRGTSTRWTQVLEYDSQIAGPVGENVTRNKRHTA